VPHLNLRGFSIFAVNPAPAAPDIALLAQQPKPQATGSSLGFVRRVGLLLGGGRPGDATSMAMPNKGSARARRIISTASSRDGRDRRL
jgi:hypothetical protein